MTLGNMPRLGVQRLVAYCLNRSCRQRGLIDVSKFPDDVEVPSFATGSCAPNAVRADALTQTYRPSLTGNVWP
jgi:hypothetical protein